LLQGTRSAMDANPAFPAFARSPHYSKELIFGCATDGVAFLRKWLDDHPDSPAVALLDDLPASGEQILHYEKHVSGDRPAVIDLSSLAKRLPEDWRPYYENSLGEFTLRALCESHEATRDSSSAIAAGWDGCRIRAFETGKDGLVVLGHSNWDSEKDAAEFRRGFSSLLQASRETADWEVRAERSRVVFVIGLPDQEERSSVLDALADAPVTGS
jgi:hypothetical protein